MCVCVLRRSLPALAATKGVDHKTTLMDYLTSMVEKKDPDLLNFHEDLNCLAEARRYTPRRNRQVSFFNLVRHVYFTAYCMRSSVSNGFRVPLICSLGNVVVPGIVSLLLPSACLIAAANRVIPACTVL